MTCAEQRKLGTKPNGEKREEKEMSIESANLQVQQDILYTLKRIEQLLENLEVRHTNITYVPPVRPYTPPVTDPVWPQYPFIISSSGTAQYVRSDQLYSYNSETGEITKNEDEDE